MSVPLGLYLSVPVASFRTPHAREYFETLPVPPPSTLYGMLLSCVGEERRARHEGAELALAALSAPPVSRGPAHHVADQRQEAGAGPGE